MRAHESFNFSSQVTADSSAFELKGGAYVIDVVANFNSGSVTLQRLGPDGATFMTAATALTANGTSGSVVLPPGSYKFVCASASAIYASVIRIPGD